MKNKYLLILLVFLFASCSLTKRRYMPGYSLDRSCRAPRIMYHAQSGISRKSVSYATSKSLIAKDLTPLPAYVDNTNDKTQFPHLTALHIHHSLIKISNTTASGKNEGFQNIAQLITELAAPAPSLFHRDKEVCSQSRTSQTTGIMSLTITLFAVSAGLILIMLKNIGGYWATVNLAVPVIIGGAVSGGILGLLAIIFGIIAIHKIHESQDLYSGIGKAVTGMVFAAILFGVLALMVV